MHKTADSSRDLLRHTLATVAYRGAKTLRGAPAAFGELKLSSSAGTRTPSEILAHVGDLFDWAFSIASGEQAWRDSKPLPWDEEVARLFAALKRFDDYLSSGQPLHAPVEQLFQGPVADALTHIGQLAMLRRLAGSAIKGENYFKAEIQAGQVGADQPPPRREF